MEYTKPILLLQGNTYDGPVAVWYVEDTDDLEDIPENAPLGSVAQVLATNGLSHYMKRSTGWVKI